jgi:nicotinate phosphoribosyltransferase
VTDAVSSLLTDRYELTMLNAAIRAGTHDRDCVFEVFARRLSGGRRYGIVAGTGRLLDLIDDFRFTDRELDWLRDNDVVYDRALDWLADYRFTGSISGYQEGEVYFPGSPILVVEGTFAEAVILETLALSVLNYDSAVATAASRMVSAASGRPLAEMGSRRTGERAAVAAARAAFIAGFAATSNLEAGRSWGVPTMGTSAHSCTTPRRMPSEPRSLPSAPAPPSSSTPTTSPPPSISRSGSREPDSAPCGSIAVTCRSRSQRCAANSMPSVRSTPGSR